MWKSVIILIISGIGLKNQMHAQDIYYNNLQVTRVQKSIRIDFTLNAGSTCNGIDIERSTDSSNFTEIGGFAGACGSPVEPVLYSFTDFSPVLNSINYYRVYFGTAVYSEVLSIDYRVQDNRTMLLYPNPCIDNLTVYLENPNFEFRTFELINMYGQIVSVYHSKEEEINIPIAEIPEGIYTIRAWDNEYLNLISSSLVNIL